MAARIQRRRTKGWRMPEGAIYVGRPSQWGNPVMMDGWQGAMQSVMMWGCRGDKRGRAEAAVKAYRLLLEAERKPVKKDNRDAWQRKVYTLRCTHEVPAAEEIRTMLGGRNLACWCALCPEHADGLPMGARCDACWPCHAAVLLEIANTPLRASEPADG